MSNKRIYLFSSLIFLIIAGISASVLLNGCKGKTGYRLTGDTIEDGKNLVQLNCTKCHQLVPVNALTKDVWKFHTLPAMAHYLGITSYLDGYFKQDSIKDGLSLLEWQTIVTYYHKVAPDYLLPVKPPVTPVEDSTTFSVKTPAASDRIVYTTMAAFNGYNHKIYTSDGVTNLLQEWDNNLKAGKSVKLLSPAVDASFVKNKSGTSNALISSIGRLEPIDFLNGKLLNVALDSANLNPTPLATELARPVQSVTGDFNKDGLTDVVVCAQGYLKGGVYLFTQDKNHAYTQQGISERPGAVKAIAGDFNNDGWLDLMVLYGRGDEGLTLYLNNQKGGFTAKDLLHFPPVYGSTDFQLTDIDHDGNPDLIYTCGYNFNDSRILKPYHGLYIFKNTGNWNFKQQWFYPINGCTKFVTADFNGDGRLDIVTSAFFADLLNNPGEGCIYFEQDKPFSFKAHTIKVSKYGRWFNMDVGDFNGDGKPDIILANYSAGFSFQQGLVPFWSKTLPFIVLENKLRK